MAETLATAVDQPAPDDLISFLKAIPDGRYRRGVRYPQWFLLLVAVLGILSGCRSSRDLEAVAKRHREALNQALGLEFKRWPSDAAFLYLFNKAHLQQFGEVLQAWMISQIPGGAEGLDQLVCDGKTLRGSAIESVDGNYRFVAQVTVYARALGVAMAQKTYDTHESSERAALKELLSTMKLDGVLIQSFRPPAIRGAAAPTVASVVPAPDCRVRPPTGRQPHRSTAPRRAHS
ncbi:transposase family protein [Synechococcus sp. J7-Johnson]|uniref:transposase family protein n=1 Tax=Synechococcus sp. J7-Johnson TaxID=2823737 RepID=UPI0020CD9B2F|nr:transposase family protein [Synechococcus sp. J7-Johnson]